MKRLSLCLSLIYFVSICFAQTVFINELHYDNVGTDDNEGLEIAGPAGTDLSCYEIYLYNGSNSSVYNSITLQGTLEDQNNGFGTHWVAIEGIQNGENDAIALYNSCTETVELFISYEGTMSAIEGVAKDMISEDIGVAEIGTESGNSLQLTGSGMVYTDFIWAEAAAATYGEINNNQSFGEGTGGTPTFNISPAERTINESTDSVTYTLQATNLTGTHIININVNEETTAILNEDYTIGNSELSIDAANGANQTIDIVMYIINDEEEEATESVEFQITVEGEEVTIANGVFTLTIEDDDAPPPTLNMYTIAEVHTENENGVADSLDVLCELSGVVHGINLREGNGLLFTIRDGTGGISIFSLNDDLGYTVTEGDEIKVQGTIGQFNGLTQIVAENITLVSEGNDLGEPIEIRDTGLSETQESEYVRMEELTIIDPTEWVGDGGSFNVLFTVDGSSDIDTVIVRIDNDTPLASLPLSDITASGNYYQGIWFITGIVGQFDNSEPYTSGYQLFPFDLDDIFITSRPSVPNYIIDQTIEVYPNPIKGDWLEVQAVTLIKSLRLYNASGLLLNETQGNQMNINDVSTGFYLLEVETNQGKTLKKIIR